MLLDKNYYHLSLLIDQIGNSPIFTFYHFKQRHVTIFSTVLSFKIIFKFLKLQFFFSLYP